MSTRPDQLVRAVLDPSNKDGEIESMKAEIEEAGIAAMRDRLGSRGLATDERVPLVSYVGLLLAQRDDGCSGEALAGFWNVVQTGSRHPISARPKR
jgi:hypothetical protein